jgi:hypothetical protein
LPRLLPQTRRDFPDAIELAVEGPGVLEGIAIDDLHRALGPNDVAGQSHLTIGAFPDGQEQFVIGDLQGGVVRESGPAVG